MGAIFLQCGHQGSMNSNSTTIPRKDDNVIVRPEKPFEVTTGSVKSGATPCEATVGHTLSKAIRNKLEIASFVSI